jgi:predicted secreted protein
MAVINGTNLLLYADGLLIAAQKSCTITVDQDLFDATNKESGGWARHGNGLLSAKIDFDALVSTTGKSYTELMAYLIARSSILLAITGLGYTMVGEVDISSISISASQESAMGLSGSLKVKGELFVLRGTKAPLVTDWTNGDYATFTDTDGAITSAISSSGTKYAVSNTFAIADTGIYKVAVFLTLNSGQAPSLSLVEPAYGDRSNVVALVAGLNIITLTATADVTDGVLRIINTASTNYSTSKVYAWKQA